LPGINLIAAIKAKGVFLDILFANAGGGTLAPIADVTENSDSKYEKAIQNVKR
jgi:NAD(P)-dependent dehydrogenase (short-subunit alcohol dehydrogenase family)